MFYILELTDHKYIVRAAQKTIQGALEYHTDDRIIIGDISPELLNKLFPSTNTSIQIHYFTPSEDDHNFCAICGLYFAHKTHKRA